jgi:hypothetical protein
MFAERRMPFSRQNPMSVTSQSARFFGKTDTRPAPVLLATIVLLACVWAQPARATDPIAASHRAGPALHHSPVGTPLRGCSRGTAASPADFRLIVIPDTQNMSANYPQVFTSMTQWISNTHVISNIVFVTHVGDIVDVAFNATQWVYADAAFDILDAAGVAYSVGPGNHDLGTLYSTHFGSSRFSGKAWYQGYFAGGNDNYNNYSFFSAAGMDFIVINLQYRADSAALDWADGLLKANPTRRAIVVQHDILNTDNSWRNQSTYQALKDNSNLFLMLCGHMHTPGDGSAYRAETGDWGQTIHILLTDYQDYPHGGDGYLRVLTFRPSRDEIYAQVYSPYVDAYLSDASNYEEFAMAYDMPECLYLPTISKQ